MRWLSCVCLLLVGCAHKSVDVVVYPSTTQVIALPKSSEKLEPSGIAHILRGLYFSQHGHSSAAIPHFRLALLYDAKSAYLHQKLAQAWLTENRLDKARETLVRGLEVAPNDAHLNTIAGELARRGKSYDEAVTHYELGLTDPHTVDAAGPGLVDVLAWQGKSADAERRGGDVMAAYPGDDDLATSIAGTFEDHGRLSAALAAYRRARELKPGSRVAAIGEMRILDLQGHPAEAATRLSDLFQFEPDDVALYAQVVRLFQRATSPSAEAYRIEVLRLAGDDQVLRAAIAAGDIYEGQTTRGLTLLAEVARRSALETSPMTRLALLTFVAETYMQAGQAGRCVAELAGLGPAVEVLRTRANCLAAVGRVDEALAQLVLSVKSGSSPHQAALDAARIVTNDDDEILARRRLSMFLKVIAPGLDKHDVSLATATIASHFGHEAEAMALIATVYATSKSDPDLKLRYADALARNDRIDESVTLLRAMVQQQPDDATLLNSLGFTLADADRQLDEAEVYLRRAYRVGSEESFIVDSLGWLLHRRGDDEGAERLLKRAMLTSPGDAEVLWHLGEVYRARGKPQDARAYFVKALAAHPPKQLRTRIQQVMPKV